MISTTNILRELGLIESGMTLLHQALCTVLLYSVFCRAVKSDRRVRPSIRHSINALGAAACMGLAAPFTGWRPDLVDLALLAGICAVQVTTARYWRHGPPAQFLRPECRPHGRRADDQP